MMGNESSLYTPFFKRRTKELISSAELVVQYLKAIKTTLSTNSFNCTFIGSPEHPVANKFFIHPKYEGENHAFICFYIIDGIPSPSSYFNLTKVDFYIYLQELEQLFNFDGDS